MNRRGVEALKRLRDAAEEALDEAQAAYEKAVKTPVEEALTRMRERPEYYDVLYSKDHEWLFYAGVEWMADRLESIQSIKTSPMIVRAIHDFREEGKR